MISPRWGACAPLSNPATLVISLDRDTIIARGPLLAGTVDLLLVAINVLTERGLIEIALDLDGIDELDYGAVAALSLEQHLACSDGRMLRIRAREPLLRTALTGCHIDPSPVTGAPRPVPSTG